VILRPRLGLVAFMKPKCHDHHISYDNGRMRRHADLIGQMRKVMSADSDAKEPPLSPDRLWANLEALGVNFLPKTQPPTDDPSPPSFSRALSPPGVLPPTVSPSGQATSLSISRVTASAFVTGTRAVFKGPDARSRIPVFASSLYDINKALEKLRKPKDAVDLSACPDWIDRDLRSVFLPAEADKPPPRRPYDHRIELEQGKSPPGGPLYQMSAGELEVLKEWLEQNLERAGSGPRAPRPPHPSCSRKNLAVACACVWTPVV
jgi:hypothetical protein